MSEKDVNSRWITLKSTGAEIRAYLAQPQGSGPFPIVVVLQEVFGVNEHIRDVTERFAREGYLAVAPAIFDRTAPGLELGYRQEDLVEGRRHKERTRADELLSDVSAAIREARRLPGTSPDRCGCVGFCFGGHVAYLAATLPDIRATASFYGAGIVNSTPGGGAPTLECTPRIHGSLYLFFGTRDPLISPDQVTRIGQTLAEHGVNHRIFQYDAGHGFFCDKRADYDRSASADAWKHTLELFARELKGEGAR